MHIFMEYMLANLRVILIVALRSELSYSQLTSPNKDQGCYHSWFAELKLWKILHANYEFFFWFLRWSLKEPTRKDCETTKCPQTWTTTSETSSWDPNVPRDERCIFHGAIHISCLLHRIEVTRQPCVQTDTESERTP